LREHGWFVVPGQQSGDRTLAEQLRGLGVLLAEVKGKTVADFGCAEGLIALEVARAGAASVIACDYNAESIEIAKGLRGELPVEFSVQNVDALVDARARGAWDVVLALAILHKLNEPERAVRFMAEAARELLVVRWQGGSDGWIRTKHRGRTCDGAGVLAACGLRLERALPGPRDELVQYWRR
jgi:SAM-dependent methyltransferase